MWNYAEKSPKADQESEVKTVGKRKGQEETEKSRGIQRMF